MNGEQNVALSIVTLPMTLSDLSHPKLPPILRFWSSFISVERLKLEPSNEDICATAVHVFLPSAIFMHNIFYKKGKTTM